MCTLSSSRMHIVAYMLERKVNEIPSAFLLFFPPLFCFCMLMVVYMLERKVTYAIPSAL